MDNKLKISLIIFTVSSILSCSSVPKTAYHDKGLNFEITPNFRIGRTTTWKKNQATYVPIRGRDKNVYAKFSVIWVPCVSDLDWEIQNYVEGLNSVYPSSTRSKPEYSEVRSTTFGSNDARQIDYVVRDDGPRVGSYTAFHCNGFTVIIGQHSTFEGQRMIERCRQLIEATYSCEHN